MATEMMRTAGPVPAPRWWVGRGALAAAAAIAAVLAVQALALAAWPHLAAFPPLDSYARSTLFVLVPAIAATALFVWLAGRSADPAGSFVKLAIVVLIASIIPDFVLPVPNKTLQASAVAASLHLVAAVVITGLLVSGYRIATRRAG